MNKIQESAKRTKYPQLLLTLIALLTGLVTAWQSTVTTPVASAKSTSPLPTPSQITSQFTSPLAQSDALLEQQIDSEVVDLGTPPTGVILFDLTIDNNGDGLPDQLVDELERREKLQLSMSIAIAQPQDKIADDFYWRFPFSDQTRKLQLKAAKIVKRLEKVKKVDEYEKLASRMQALTAEMMQDPNFALVQHTFDVLVQRRIDAKIDWSARTEPVVEQQNVQAVVVPNVDVRPKVYLPAIFGEPKIDFSKIKRGDIMLIDSGGKFTQYIYKMRWGHSGNYDGTASTAVKSVYESNGDGVRLKPLDNWQETGKFVGLSYDNKITQAQSEDSLTWAKNKWGTDGRTPYNINFANKTTDSALYCSQLAWKIHINKNIDLDSNNTIYHDYVRFMWGQTAVDIAIPAVAPDEIGLSPNITMYSAGLNP